MYPQAGSYGFTYVLVRARKHFYVVSSVKIHFGIIAECVRALFSRLKCASAQCWLRFYNVSWVEIRFDIAADWVFTLFSR